jgi:hypothetical protein
MAEGELEPRKDGVEPEPAPTAATDDAHGSELPEPPRVAPPEVVPPGVAEAKGEPGEGDEAGPAAPVPLKPGPSTTPPAMSAPGSATRPSQVGLPIQRSVGASAGARVSLSGPPAGAAPTAQPAGLPVARTAGTAAPRRGSAEQARGRRGWARDGAGVRSGQRRQR